jgi:hypothetical protein
MPSFQPVRNSHRRSTSNSRKGLRIEMLDEMTMSVRMMITSTITIQQAIIEEDMRVTTIMREQDQETTGPNTMTTVKATLMTVAVITTMVVADPIAARVATLRITPTIPGIETDMILMNPG